MIRRNNRNVFSSVSRNVRRAQAAIVRANRSNAKWMKRYEERKNRFARWRKAFTFIPLNFSRFVGYVSAFFNMLATAMRDEQSRVAMNRSGILGSKRNRRRGKRASVSPTSYESLEDRKMLATVGFESPTPDDNAQEFATTGTVNNGQFAIELGVPSDGPTTVEFTLGGTAAIGQDFDFDTDQVSGAGTPADPFTVTFADGESRAEIDINVIDDFLFDPAETVQLTITDPGMGNTIDTMANSDSIIIEDNEALPGISVSAVGGAAEGDPTTTSSGSFTIDFTTAYDSDTDVTIDVTGTAIGGDDFIFSSSESLVFTPNTSGVLAAPSTLVVTVPAGATSVTINVCLLYTSPSPRDATLSRMPSSA